MKMSKTDDTAFEAAYLCYICRRPFTRINGRLDKVKDHDHITGKFRGAVHNSCNMQLRSTYKIPVILHNFRGYDSHLVVSALDIFPEIECKVIGQSMEKYLTLTWGPHIVFKDSLQFMPCSLETLASNLLKSGRGNFKHFLANTDNTKPVDMLLRKGVYPYDYMDSWARFKETALLASEAFFNRLRDSPCSEEDYLHAQNVRATFGC